jgi:hypothetical protein
MQSSPFLARFNIIERFGEVLSITCFIRVFGRYPVQISPWRPSVPFQFLRGGHLFLLASQFVIVNPLSPELNPICYLLALLAHDILHVSRIRVKSLTLRLLMSHIYIYI